VSGAWVRVRFRARVSVRVSVRVRVRVRARVRAKVRVRVRVRLINHAHVDLHRLLELGQQVLAALLERHGHQVARQHQVVMHERVRVVLRARPQRQRVQLPHLPYRV